MIEKIKEVCIMAVCILAVSSMFCVQIYILEYLSTKPTSKIESEHVQYVEFK